MDERRKQWRCRLMGGPKSIARKREVFDTYVRDRRDISDDILRTIQRDMPRTYPKVEWVSEHLADIESLLIAYAAVQKGDSYLQGFNYHMTILYHVFQGTEHAFADTWWCFARIVGLIRPLIPDFNTTWFQWARRHWTDDLFKRIRRSRPYLHSIIETHKEHFSTLVTCKWFMLWFAQTVPWTDIFELWDIFIQVPPKHLLKTYTLITHEILKEAAPTITYSYSNDPANVLHALLSIRVKGIQKMAARIVV